MAGEFDSGGTGGGGSPSEQEQEETESRRRLRRDADSDPMREQTETEEVRRSGPTRGRGSPSSDPFDEPTEPEPDNQPPAGESKPPAGGGGGGGGGSGRLTKSRGTPSGGVNNPSAGPTGDTGGNSPPPGVNDPPADTYGAGGGLEAEEPREWKKSDLAVARQFVRENPAYDTDDIADVKKTDSGEYTITFTESGRDVYVDQNYQPGATTGEAPAGAENLIRAPGEDPTTAFNQGAEAGTGSIAETARDVEGDFLENNPGLSAEDVAVNLDGNDSFSVSLTDSGADAYREQQTNRINDVLTGASGSLSDVATMNDTGAEDLLSGASGRLSDVATMNNTQREIGQLDQGSEFQSSQDGPPALTTADRELVEGEMDERGREQFGDIDWSFGLGDPDKDEVERFVDEQIGQGGSEFVQTYFSDPLREGGSNFSLPTPIAPGGQNAAAMASADAAGNLAEDLPRLPGAVLEGVELADYLLESTPVAGGSEQQFDKRAGKTGAATLGVLSSEVERAKDEPGTVAAELVLSYGAGKAISASKYTPELSGSSAIRRTAGDYTPDLPERKGSFLGDERGQADLTGMRRSRDVDSDSADVDLAGRDTIDELQRQETNTLAKQAQEQVEYQVEQRYGSVERESVPEFRDELQSDNPSAGDIDPGAQRGGNPQVASGEDISFSENFDRAIRAKNVPGDDLRQLDRLSRDLADSPMMGTATRRNGGGLTGGILEGITVGGGTTGNDGGLTGGILESITVGEGTTDATQPATFDLDPPKRGGREDVGLSDGALLGSLSGTQTGTDLLGSQESFLTAESTTSGLADGLGYGTDSSSISESVAGADTITDTGIGAGFGSDIAVGSGTDTATKEKPATAAVPDTDLIGTTTPAPPAPPAADNPIFGPEPNDRPVRGPTPEVTIERARTSDGRDSEGGDRKRRRRRRDTFAKVEERSLLNPFTGE